MKIVIAPDSFKESLAAAEVAKAIEAGIKTVLPGAHTVCVPMADGGEGTLDAVLAVTGGERRELTVADAIGRPRAACWGLLPDNTAVIEMASAAGLEHIAPADRNPMSADTYGVGELIADALDSGAQRIVLTAGGSATNDAGAGMLLALGIRFLDKDDTPLPRGGQALAHLHKIDTSKLDPRLKQLELVVATDVRNPLCGSNGASAIFGPQKGATPEMVTKLDQALANFALITAQATGEDLQSKPGAGAAGGLGFAAMAWLGACTRPGVEVVAELANLEQSVADADLVFTGEGRMDSQTLQGKTPWGVMRIAQAHNVPVVALAGSLGDGYQALYDAGLTAAFSLANGPIDLPMALKKAPELITARTTDIMRLWLVASHERLMHHSSE
ncbi:glycerate kinase [Orrella daihaiensis]|uniref:Glycerate kinase n=1 Tax=Orrella daihaiensis TaxID=2782176 RepID=A0ABY4AIF2_9BURK|nr:glycerate kinase [Orrella daihaiensis]UOD49959.1 glycerate kinase [Orrella daihaiensis]